MNMKHMLLITGISLLAMIVALYITSFKLVLLTKEIETIKKQKKESFTPMVIKDKKGYIVIMSDEIRRVK